MTQSLNAYQLRPLDVLTDDDFKRIASFVQGHSGIKLPASKKIMVEGRLRRRAQALNLDCLDEYCRVVLDGDDMKSELHNLIDAITTNKTDFFREEAHFKFLTASVLPEFVESHRKIKIWSAACSNGAEPYTLAMVLDDFHQDRGPLRHSIIASDISSDVLDKAKRAVYPLEMIDPIPMAMRFRYVLRSKNPAKAVFRMNKEIRNSVHYCRINLVDKRYPVDRDLDVIFCRNLLIYFDKPTQHAVVAQLCSHLRPGGYLILGHADSLAGASLPLQPLGNSIYRWS